MSSSVPDTAGGDPAQRISVRIYEDGILVFSTEVAGPVELGRQLTGERSALLTYRLADSGSYRVVIAPAEEVSVSRRHALVEPLPDGWVRVINISGGSAVRLGDGTVLGPGDSRELDLPCRLNIGKRSVGLEGQEPRPRVLEQLEATPVPDPLSDTSIIRRIAMSSGKVVDTEAILRWLQTSVVVIQSAATSKDFLGQVARGVIEVGLENGAVLMRGDGGWVARAFCADPASQPTANWRPSSQILAAVCEHRRTVWEKPVARALDSKSLEGVEVVVAAPILDQGGEVIGVVYGDRRRGAVAELPINRLKAMLVELLASGVAAGLARLEQERAAVAARVRFEEFFTPELSRELEAHPDLLRGRDVEVTILVVDIRGFSRISERLGPAKTVDWIREMMQALSDCVLDQHGVVVDYVGDEILAMWGAPKEQPDHAARACTAAVRMLESLPRLNERWQDTLGEPIEIGIGVNTGMARVGNVGSDRKFKYGPLGNTVNLASRVQGATKYLRTKVVVTGATRSRLGEEFRWRRLCRVRVVNIHEPVDLYELAAAGNAEFDDVRAPYESALETLEAGRFEEAAKLLGEVMARRSNDGPALVLMSRVLECLTGGAVRFDPVWTLPGK